MAVLPIVAGLLAGSGLQPSGPSAYLVKDIQTDPEKGVGFSEWVQGPESDDLHFFARDPENGMELWKTDGTEAGTGLIRDTGPGYLGPSGRGYQSPNRTIFFVSQEESTGEELWRSDGTASGTVLVKDINPGRNGSFVIPLGFLQNRFFFTAWDGVRQLLWRTDGTEAGTIPLREATLRGGGFVARSTTFLYLVANGADEGLWESDGTEAGTTQVRSIVSHAGPCARLTPCGLYGLVGADDRLYFFEWNPGTIQLWTSDGTPEGTVPLATFRPAGFFSPTPPAVLGTIGGRLLFSASSASGFPGDLWVSDGTAVGTTRLLSSTSGLASVGTIAGAFHFIADSALWRTDGTLAGTGKLYEPLTPPGFERAGLAGSDGSLYFSACDAAHGCELWRTDGRAAGTALVKDIVPGADSSHASRFVLWRGGVFFGVGDAIWQTDGSEAGTRLVTDLRKTAATASSGARPMAALSETVFVMAAQSGINRLWKSDGSENGTVLLHGDLSPLGLSGRTDSAVLGPWLLFAGFLDGSGLWRSDGTSIGTELVRALDGYPFGISRVGEKVLFLTSSFEGISLWTSDGTSEGTRLIRSLSPEFLSFDFGVQPPEIFAELQGVTFLLVSTSTELSLWRTDGTEAGTSQVWMLPGESSSVLRSAGSFLYFTSRFFDTTLWRSDGTEAGTVEIHRAPMVSELASVGSQLFFTVGPRGGPPDELWKTVGSLAGTLRVKSFRESGGFLSREMVRFGEGAYFAADDGAHGLELWRSDGTEAGTEMVREIAPGRVGSSPGSFATVGRSLFFAASDGIHGHELWTYDGTTEGPRLFQDLAPGPGSSSPFGFTVAGGRVYFSADDNVSGRELWAAPAPGIGLPRRGPRIPRIVPPRRVGARP